MEHWCLENDVWNTKHRNPWLKHWPTTINGVAKSTSWTWVNKANNDCLVRRRKSGEKLSERSSLETWGFTDTSNVLLNVPVNVWFSSNQVEHFSIGSVFLSKVVVYMDRKVDGSGACQICGWDSSDVIRTVWCTKLNLLAHLFIGGLPHPVDSLYVLPPQLIKIFGLQAFTMELSIRSLPSWRVL